MQASRTSTPARSMPRIVASFAMLAALAGCGYKGPLYMPPPPPPEASLTKPPTSVPLPATQAPDQSGAQASPIK